MRHSLFRPDVITSKRTSWLGQVILVNPVSFTFYSAFSLIIALALIGFVCLGQYTKRVTVNGLLMPNLGLVKIQSPQPGIIVERRVKEGQTVEAGDVLYVVSGELELPQEKDPGRAIDSNRAILEVIRARQNSLVEEQGQATRIGQQQVIQLDAQLRGLRAELDQLTKEIGTQKVRVASAEAQFQRNEKMRSEGFISASALQQNFDQLLDQRERLQSLERDRMTLDRSINDASNGLVASKAKNLREQTQLRRQTIELDQQSLAAESHRKFVVTAPQAGTVTTILAEPGQAVANQTLLTILPKEAHLEAQLFVPSRSIGFVERGQTVAIRFAAFPYQKYGQHIGLVKEVSKSVLTQQELPSRLEASAGATNAEGMYRVRVELAERANEDGKKKLSLSSGMQIEADILQDRRTLIEWLLEPMLGWKEKV